MIDLLMKLLPTAHSSAVETTIRQVAESSIEGVCQRVSPQIDHMTLSEARGYVRARAVEIVQAETRRSLAGEVGALQRFDFVVRSAIERLVPAVLRRTGVGVPRPVSHVTAA